MWTVTETLSHPECLAIFDASESAINAIECQYRTIPGVTMIVVRGVNRHIIHVADCASEARIARYEIRKFNGIRKDDGQPLE